MNKVYAWYNSLPPKVKIAMGIAEGAAGAAIWQWYTTGGIRFDKTSLTQLGSLVVGAVVLALHNLFKGSPSAT